MFGATENYYFSKDSMKKSIGIWGFGTVGKSALHYFDQQGFNIHVMDAKNISKTKQKLFHEKKITFKLEKNNEFFFSFCDFLFSSPGIDIRKYYQKYYYKWIRELDLFYQNFGKPIIAVTGSVGKTSITHLLESILSSYGIQLCVGGNMGTPSLDLLYKKNTCDVALLEVSSFQLEYCKSFSPDLAIWTNFYPNHLDRHTSLQQYFDAKFSIIANQHRHQHALLPFSLRKKIRSYKNFAQQLSYFSLYRPSYYERTQLDKHEKLFYIHKGTMYIYTNDLCQKIINVSVLPPITFDINWLIICSALHLLQAPLQKLPTITHNLSLPEHRLEYVGTYRMVQFYNDSKSTTPASTITAIQKFKKHPIKLFLGGLSKGIDRAPFIRALKDTVDYIYCFGAEAAELHYTCKQCSIPSQYYNTLESAFSACIKSVQPGNIVLFSPAGSSFDLYKNYCERGNHFKELVYDYREKNKAN